MEQSTQPMPSDLSNADAEHCGCVCGETATTRRRIAARDEVHGGVFVYETCARCRTERVARRPHPAAIGRFYPDTYYAYTPPAAQQRPPLSDRLKRLVYEVFHAAPGERSARVRRHHLLLRAALFPLRFRTNLAFHPPSQRRAFEIGAATGSDLLEFRAAGWEVTGCEPSARACDVAARRGVALQNCSAENAVLDADRYGCVLINNVFEHLHDPAAVLRNVHRALVHDGVLVIIVPNHASWAARVFGASWPGYDPPRHLWGFTPESISALLRQNGFAVDHVAHKAPQRWCWTACIEGTRRPTGSTRRRQALARYLAPALVPLGLLPAALRRGDFIKVVARRAAA